MKSTYVVTLAAAALISAVLTSKSHEAVSADASIAPERLATSQDGLDKLQGKTLQELMKLAEKYTKPGRHHKVLARFIGKWDTEMRVLMGRMPPSKGEAEWSWLMPGRWIQGMGKGKLMGRPFDTCTIMGYDNFKQSYVQTTVSSADTAMNRGEGDMTRDGKKLICYGTLDEYTTGEHDKMVKYVWDFVSKDKMVLEVHDLPIGEKNTKVVEVTYTRKK